MPVTQTVLISASPSQPALQMKLFIEYTDTIVATVIPTAGVEDPSLYTGVFTDVPAGRYRCVLFSSGDVAAVDDVTLTLTTDTFPCEDLQPPAAADNSEQLDRIESQTSLITAARVNVLATVTRGGTITLERGSDYRTRSTTQIDLPVDDAGAVLYDYLTDTDAVASVIFGAGRLRAHNQITGTVDPDAITAAAGITTIPIEIPGAQISEAAAADDYTYHIKAIAPVIGSESAGDESVRVKGCLIVESERAAP